MKVLLLNGSPRTEGNTNLALNEMAKQLEKNGIVASSKDALLARQRGCQQTCGRGVRMPPGRQHRGGTDPVDAVPPDELSDRHLPILAGGVRPSRRRGRVGRRRDADHAYSGRQHGFPAQKDPC